MSASSGSRLGKTVPSGGARLSRPESGSGFEKIVSVGMFEHVGESQLPLYFQHAWRLLRPGGVFLNHGIANRPIDPVPKGPNFISRYVFPDGDLVPINATLRYAEESRFRSRATWKVCASTIR